MPKSTKRSTKVLAMPRPSAGPELGQSPNPADAAIATRAFELYCARGCQDGRDVEDWLQAERELLEEANYGAARSDRVSDFPGRREGAGGGLAAR